MNIQGFKVNFLGDSITEGVGVTDPVNCRYDNLVGKMLGLSQVNSYGIGGTRIAYQPSHSTTPRYDLYFCGRAYVMDPSADMVVVYGGVNDYLHGDADFGEMSDRTHRTFCGAVYSLMSFLKEQHPNATVVFMTPAHCHYKGVSDKQVSIREMKQADAKPLQAYVDVIKARGKELGVPVLDLFENLGLDPNLESDKENFTVDGLHFNDEGHAYIAKALGDFLTAL